MIMNLVIVGGVAGGASAATRARRLSEQANIIVFERGSYASFANCGLPYFIGGKIEERESLFLMTPESFKARWNIDLRTRCQVLSVDREMKEVEVKDLSTGSIFRQPYDKLVLSPGAYPFKPPIPGINSTKLFTLRNIPDADAIIRKIQSETINHAVIVGGGFIGLEMAENLKSKGLNVSIVEMLNQVLPSIDPEMAVRVHHHLKENDVSLFLGSSVTGFAEKGNKIVAKLENGEEINSDLVVLAIGVRPEVHLCRDAGLKIGVKGGIQVNDRLETSDPDIYAIGDAVEVKHYVTGKNVLVPMAGPAVKQARIAADNIFGRCSRYNGTQGTSVVKVFDLTVGSTGANEKLLRDACIPYKKSYLYPFSHATYYPGSEFLSMKLLFDPKNGRILGAQVIGERGVDKRVDVLATAIRANMTVYDLEELELAYAPPYGSAKDPINMAGYVAANDLRRDINVIHPLELIDLDPKTVTILDVRTESEYENVHINGVLHIPVDELRERFDEVPREVPVIVYCEAGVRSYYAYRILVQRGFKISNLSGGMKNYLATEEFEH
jgi:NADPH-dependent 2,4-dienoyl-CoA reductase/sulfur reductase-like enzyme/rhodanese-related sulfurtransferase